MEVTVKKYIVFKKEFIKGRKTPIVTIHSAKDDTLLGDIRWWSAWRKYVFCPDGDTIFDAKCLSEIELYMEGL